jgi:hypothetical protein
METSHAHAAVTRLTSEQALEHKFMTANLLPAATTERRVTLRHDTRAHALQASVLGDSTPRTARIRDLSASGIGLLFEGEVNVDKLAVVQLFNPIRQCWHSKTIRVLYAIPQPDGRFLTGGSFLHPLTADECREVLLDSTAGQLLPV